jgi:hypothetical protein
LLREGRQFPAHEKNIVSGLVDGTLYRVNLGVDVGDSPLTQPQPLLYQGQLTQTGFLIFLGRFEGSPKFIDFFLNILLLTSQLVTGLSPDRLGLRTAQ